MVKPFEQPFVKTEDYRSRDTGLVTSPTDGMSSASQALYQAPGLGTFIGKYHLIECLGRGGQGIVFRAVHPTLGRDVVIKLASQSLRPEQRQRLLDEGRMLARLDDPGVVRVYDVDTWEGKPYIVCEYVAGMSLSKSLKSRRYSVREAVALAADIAAIVERIHQRGVTHRDLKPANILIDPHGKPRVLDFGLAALGQQWLELAESEQDVSGTPAYMAPEQANGKVEQLGPRTDVYGLGAILYQLLSGMPPRVADTPEEIWEAARQGAFTPLRQHQPRIRRGLDQLCQQALARDPDQRMASAGQFEQKLRAYLRRPRLLAAALLGVAAVVVGIVLVLPALQREQPPVARPGPKPENQVIVLQQTAAATEKPAEPPPGWQTYRSPMGGYSVWLPGTPAEGQAGVAGKRGEIQMQQVSLKDVSSGLNFHVNHADFNHTLFPDADKALDGARDGAMKKSGAELIREERITFGNHPGRELWFALPKAKGLALRMRIYLVGQRNYQLLVGGAEPAVQGPAAETFFRSFRLDREF